MQTSLLTRSESRARIKALWAGLLRVSGVLPLAKSWVRRKGALVLTFHRVLTDDDLKQTASMLGMLVREKTFADFLAYAAKKCEFMDLSRDPDWQPGSRLKLAVTFDDGWSDNASIAYHIARKHQAPIAIFIVTNKLGETLPFWPERAVSALNGMAASSEQGKSRSHIEETIEELKRLPASERNQRIEQMVAEHPNTQVSSAVDQTMSWEQVAQLHHGGVTFGSHTCTHEILTTIPPAEAKEEIAASREHVKEKLSAPCRLFSYPNGDWSECVRELVKQSGYKFAFLNQQPGIWTKSCDPYLIPRVNVCEYHLVDPKGNFSPLTFEYAVIWSAAKGLLAQTITNRMLKIRRKMQALLARPDTTSATTL
ncbi:MAG TPA: polysaccharide deacetylase family protein [Candidatus Angelobacter sp.]|nr:polysaccharide deacetylase family protein [Candidatus Angelobacter sp.]